MAIRMIRDGNTGHFPLRMQCPVCEKESNVYQLIDRKTNDADMEQSKIAEPGQAPAIVYSCRLCGAIWEWLPERKKDERI